MHPEFPFATIIVDQLRGLKTSLPHKMKHKYLRYSAGFMRVYKGLQLELISVCVLLFQVGICRKILLARSFTCQNVRLFVFGSKRRDTLKMQAPQCRDNINVLYNSNRFIFFSYLSQVPTLEGYDLIERVGELIEL